MKTENENLKNIVDGIGSFIEYWGFRKIHGRIWGLLFLSDKPLSTPEIIEILGVSKALTSGAINELLEHNLIEKVGEVKYGGYSYCTTKSPAEAVREIIKNRELVLLHNIDENVDALQKLSAEDLKDLGVDANAVKNLKLLTRCHIKIVQKLCKKKIVSIQDWINFMKRFSRLSF